MDDPRMKNVKNTQYDEGKPSKLSELLYLLLAFLAIGAVGVLAYFILNLVLFGSNDSEKDPVVAGLENSVELLDAHDGSDCSSFESQSNELFKTLSSDRKWYLIGSEFTSEQKRIIGNAQLNKSLDEASAGIKRFEIKFALVEGASSEPASSSDKVNFSGAIDISSTAPGKKKIVAIADTSCGKVTSSGHEVNISYPIYIAWTLDWEGKYVTQASMDQITRITASHGIEATHFYNPRLFTSAIAEGDRARYLNWVKDRRDNHGDEIGLHLHMFYDLVQAAGVQPQTGPAWGWPNASSELGYDVIVSGYSYDEMNKILDFSTNVFVQNGLNTPTLFRAGGWQTDSGTLQVLEDNGFLVDSSGRDRFTLGSNNIPVPWLLESTTQPYRPAYYSQNETNASPRDQMKIWEFPNNGLDSTANNYNFLYQRFVDNYDGSPLTERKTVNYLSHPDYFDYDVRNGIDTLFTMIDNHSYKADKGPVLYEDLGELYQIWIAD